MACLKIDHHDAVYGVLAHWLHLDRSVCAARDLKLVVVDEAPAYIGFMRPSPQAGLNEQLSVFIGEKREPRSDYVEGLVYEAVKLPPSGTHLSEPSVGGKTDQQYAVVGV